LSSELLLQLVLLLSAFAAGAVNSVAGGGTLLTFPALLSVLSPVMANGTSTIALLSGTTGAAWAYRLLLEKHWRMLLTMALPSLIGGVCGTLLASRAPERYFTALVPWLILLATGLFAAQPLVARWVRNQAEVEETAPPGLATIWAIQLVIGVYGGYFGAGNGIVQLSALAWLGMRNLHEANALKSALAFVVNGSAALTFVLEGRVTWRYSLPMAVAAVLGGYAGSRFGQKLPQYVVRWIVTTIGLVLGLWYLRPA
jgi:uncharacterized protein